jgi:hypothetical protein
MTKAEPSSSDSFTTISVPEEDIPNSKLRLFVTTSVSVFIAILVFIDVLLGLWAFGVYLILFALGLIACTIAIWILLRWNEGHRQEDQETFLEKWGDEIGWPLMILAFTIQFVLPQIRPILLGAILGGSWLLVIWNRKR